MKQRMIAALIAATAMSVHAVDANLTGVWVLSPEQQAKVAEACRGMTLEFTTDGRVVRTTGELIYVTAVSAARQSNGWVLQETLESQNGKPACSGKLAREVMGHLQRSAYVEVSGSTLRYFRTEGAERALEFRRSDSLSR